MLLGSILLHFNFDFSELPLILKSNLVGRQRLNHNLLLPRLGKLPFNQFLAAELLNLAHEHINQVLLQIVLDCENALLYEVLESQYFVGLVVEVVVFLHLANQVILVNYVLRLIREDIIWLIIEQAICRGSFLGPLGYLLEVALI